ncbi:hypothetical protein QQS21_004117 [Conoideocrella luteorostrata]|uniref:SH3 domain-containing protein n=1 Tax=Conoideocrella luteorostrata TaxID=1105319 RepID=A0AAJ0CS36_9HYPO|nr:hypothetical protein QQS21_004117 [Conoideocrella luteorostrata]
MPQSYNTHQAPGHDVRDNLYGWFQTQVENGFGSTNEGNAPTSTKGAIARYFTRNAFLVSQPTQTPHPDRKPVSSSSTVNRRLGSRSRTDEALSGQSLPFQDVAHSPYATPPTSAEAARDISSAALKTGIVLTVLGGVCIVALGAFILISRYRRQASGRREPDNEKTDLDENTTISDARTIRSLTNSSCVSLQSVTRLSSTGDLENHGTKISSVSSDSKAATEASLRQDNICQQLSNDQATRLGTLPVKQAEHIHEDLSAISLTENVSEAAVGTVDATGDARKPSLPKIICSPGPLVPEPAFPSPIRTNSSPVSKPKDTQMSPQALRLPSSYSVYKIQFDFEPSRVDELALSAGGFVRLVHEYDDGWALVARLDRFQQGVVPRCCLSSVTLKHRSPQRVSRLRQSIISQEQWSRHPQNLGHRRVNPSDRLIGSQGMHVQTRFRQNRQARCVPGFEPMSSVRHSICPRPRYGESSGQGDLEGQDQETEGPVQDIITSQTRKGAC